ncbi:hypothetical protein AB6896_00515 [Rahnella inusitata]|uniref:hypothetical protein n=1 Tax=Rahnella inusitata TaxID=58169 RepID=UPI0039BE2200
MPLFDNETRLILEMLFDDADKKTHTLYSQKLLADENSCTVNLTSLIHQNFPKSLPFHINTYSQKLTKSAEEAWGVDAIIILIDHEIDVGKIILFEAKTKRHNWDYIKPNSNPPVSHFSTQLKRQKVPQSKGYVVWEQFYSGISKASSQPLNGGASSCVLHEIALHVKGDPTYASIWSDSDIKSCCNYQISKNYPISMGGLVLLACECQIGTPFTSSEIITELAIMPHIENALLIERSSPEMNNDLSEALRKKFGNGDVYKRKFKN